MKKLLSIFLAAITLFALASCGEDSADYSRMAVPVDGFYWGMSIEDGKKVLEQKKIAYTETTAENPGEVCLKLEEKSELYDVATENVKLYFYKTDGLNKAIVLFTDADETVLLDSLEKKYGECKESEMSNSEIGVWSVPIEMTLNSIKNQKLLDEAEKFYLETLPPMKEEALTIPWEEQLEKFLDSLLVGVTVRKFTTDDSLYMYFDASSAAIAKNLETLGADGYYEKIINSTE